MKSKLILILIFLSIVIFASGCVQENGQPAPTPTPVQGKIIEITSSGFNPDTLTINVSETVTFVNKDTVPHWVATDPHPGHDQYPEYFEQPVPVGCSRSKFDACRGLPQGETFSFTFNLTGTWTYHDHLNPLLKGTVVVQ